MGRPKAARPDLPRYVSAYTDRHGQERYRFRRAGVGSIQIRHMPGTPHFEDQYQELLRLEAKAEKPSNEIELLEAMIAQVSALRTPRLHSFVYAIGEAVDETAPIKIGFATDPLARLYSLQTGNPRRLTIIGLRAGTRTTERDIHRRLSGARMVGEWFERQAVYRIMKTRGFWLTRSDFFLAHFSEGIENNARKNGNGAPCRGICSNSSQGLSLAHLPHSGNAIPTVLR